LEITVCEADLRVGGSWRVVHRAPDGTEFRFHGEFLELDPPHKRVGTFVYKGAPENVATETMVCEPVDGGTMLVSTMVHDSVEARDMHVASGMEEGILDAYSRLDELVAEERSQ
ncbi:MAG TPA: SRPBCC domain-containing protein, partial [Acidimicrobiales bacterium]|nr:SRPBCC domain-containing protein [Acidimicrobiales bacterium]